MIDPKELRIGSFVLLGKKEVIVNGVDGVSSFNILIGNDYYGDDEINAIPITHEWLERLGFVKYHRGDLILGMGYFELEFDVKNGWLYLSCNEYQDMLPHIKSIHQVQNLCYLLTGSEVTIKDKV